MGYTLAAVIAPAGPLSEAVADLPPAHVVTLEQGMALVPVTDELHDLVPGPHLSEDFVFLAGWLQESLARWSARASFAYVEVDYFGGTGGQRAAVGSRSRLSLGPLLTDSGDPGQGSPLSRALRLLGVPAEGHPDELSSPPWD